MVRRVLVFVIVCALTLPAAPLGADARGGRLVQSSASCGGTAPIKESCTATQSFHARPYQLVVQPDTGFTGRLIGTVTTTSGFETHDCQVRAYPVIFSCTYTSSGAFYGGQVYSLAGEAFRSVGNWSVRVVN